jgi:hypothetical protein
MKHTTAVLAAVLLAVVEPESADAATSVRSCTGATVKLKVIEKRMLKLHNRARRQGPAASLCPSETAEGRPRPLQRYDPTRLLLA